MSAFPPAPFPCGLIKARQALEEERLGLERLPRGLREHGDDEAKRNESTEGTVRQMELNQSAAGENETLKDGFGQSTHTEGDTGQAEVTGNKTLVDSVTQMPLGAGVPVHGGAVGGTPRPGEPGRGPAPWHEPTQGPVWQEETTEPAARQEEVLENAIPTARAGLHWSSDRGRVSDMPQFVQINVSSTLQHNGSRITGGTLCHRGHCPWQVILVWP